MRHNQTSVPCQKADVSHGVNRTILGLKNVCCFMKSSRSQLAGRRSRNIEWHGQAKPAMRELELLSPTSEAYSAAIARGSSSSTEASRFPVVVDLTLNHAA
jgi:hypothetical protein